MFLKTDGKKSSKDSQTNKIFSKHLLSGNFKMELCLIMRLVWKLLGLKLTILTAFF